MILKSITLTGFKSFAKKTVIDISKNVTGIVGPNGSGKSNIAEAVRFVMGEQSMKSIRSKSMSDLVFKGSEYIGQMSRASVSIEIDNKIKIYNEGVSPELAAYLAYDEIVLSREVFVDGGSVYKINGGEVRLKDVQSLLALAGIGASAHTIISQGEADKILTSTGKDRKEMIEDALGLKIHQIRLKDSERKIKKVNEHLHTVELLRREIAPELSHLKIQMEKINKIEGEREKLLACYLNFFAFESDDINRLKNKIGDNKNIDELIESKKVELGILKNRELELKNKAQNLENNSEENKVQSLENNLEEDNSGYNNKKDSEKNNEKDSLKELLDTLEKEITILSEQRFEKERELSMLMYEKKSLLSKIEKEIISVTFNRIEFVDFKNKLNAELSKLNNLFNLESKDLNINKENNSHLENSLTSFNFYIEQIKNINLNIKNILSFGDEYIKENNNQNINIEIKENENKVEAILLEIENIKSSIESKNNKIKQELEIKNKLIKEEENKKLELVRSIYSEMYKLEKEVSGLETQKQGIINDMQNLQRRESDFVFKLEEASRFVGQKVLNYKFHNIDTDQNVNQGAKINNKEINEEAENGKNLEEKINIAKSIYSHYENERLIERLKIRIEEIGVLDPSNVKNSFEEMSSRDMHLSKEIEDLEKTQKSVEQIIAELETNIKVDFNKGIEKINFAFNNLFHEVFPGGRASIKVEKSLDKNEEGEEIVEVIEEINLSISLPSKKVSDINMLSGGEKTLASIALLFALTSITPPPFMVLDETDAALDEMNARKYGKLLARLAEKSRLLVITHNRETMNECDILYGVTVGGDGSSKILSIKFD